MIKELSKDSGMAKTICASTGFCFFGSYNGVYYSICNCPSCK